MAEQFDVVVIGGGPAGYVAAIKCAQLGMRVACVESRSTLGGTCLNVGCIPSKALLHSSHKYDEAKHHLATHGISVKDVTLDLTTMMMRKDTIVAELTNGIEYLFKKNKVTWIKGQASFVSPENISVRDADGKITTISSKHYIIATGSNVATLPNITIDEKQILSSEGALQLDRVPKQMVVMGGGYIGLEMASVWRRLGAEVSVIEFSDRIVPAMDSDLSNGLHKLLLDQGITFHLNHKVIEATPTGKCVHVKAASTDGVSLDLEADIVLVAIGRRPNTDGLGLETLGITTDDKGVIPVNDRYQTIIPTIYAIGDVIGGMMLAHKAEDEGMVVAEIIAGQRSHVNYAAIPSVIYTYPEVASVGKTEDEMKAANIEIKIAKFPMLANSRAKANGETKGFVKVITDAKTDQVLGIHIIAADAGAMIAEAALAMEYKASAEDIARTCHAHPTTAEALKEAALGAWSKSIHI
jgi:dihydrolipoamide dehydrogenase